MMRVFATFLLSIACLGLWSQGSLVQVQVVDAKTNEGLSYAFIQVAERNYSTDEHGQVYLSIKAKDTLCLSRMAYHDTCLIYRQGNLLRLALRERSVLLLEAQVLSAQERHGQRIIEQRATRLVAYARDLSKRALVLGEEDLLKGLQFLPGVQGGTPGSANIHVRGGSNYQNQILLDNIPIYNVSHLLGSTSPFPSRSIESVSLYKDAIPIHLNGGSSSVITMATPSGIRAKRKGSLGVGFGSLSMDVSQPILKERASIDLAARFSSTGLGTALNDLFNYSTGDRYYHSFEDVLSNVNWRFQNQNQLKFSFYYSRDASLSQEKNGRSEPLNSRRKIFNRNLAFGLNFKSQYSQKSIINQQLYYSRYNAGEENYDSYQDFDFQFNTSFSDLAYELQFRHFFSPKRESVLGFKPSITTMQYPSWRLRENSSLIVGADTTYQGPVYALFNGALYYQEDWRLDAHWRASAAFRLQLHQLRGGAAQVLGLPRGSITYSPNNNLSLVLAYDELSQSMHRQRWSNFVGIVDYAFPSSSHFPVERNRQLSISSAWGTQRIGLSLQAFYRHLSNAPVLADHAPTFQYNSFYLQNNDVVLGRPQDYLELADGYAYGLESGFKASFGTLNFDLAYAWTRAYRLSEALNNGRPFKYGFNHEHNLRTNLSFKFKRTTIGKVVAIGLSWFYGSGQYTTFPLHHSPPLDIPATTATIPLATARNEQSLPPVHHLDLVISTIKETPRGIRTLSLSIFNVYMSEIPFNYIWNTSTNNFQRTASLGIEGMVPIVPSLIYKYRWK